jgi:MYXO-CTERM domain-containing protein
VTDATVTFETDFEGCGECDQSTRITYAEAALSAYGADTVDASTMTGPVVGEDAGEDAGAPCSVPTLGMSGVCILTTACAAMPGHVSTPGYCPGPDDIECCTGPQDEEDAGPSDGGAPDTGSSAVLDSGPAPSSADSAAPSDPDAGSGKASVEDASATVKPEGGLVSTGPPREGPAADAPGTEPDHASKGCSSAPRGTPGPGVEWWAIALVLVGLRRRTMRS